jgi:hypothetical protein
VDVGDVPGCFWWQNRADWPWYPTMRLFRQPTPGNWPVVVSEVAIELKRVSQISSEEKPA